MTTKPIVIKFNAKTTSREVGKLVLATLAEQVIVASGSPEMLRTLELELSSLLATVKNQQSNNIPRGF